LAAVLAVGYAGAAANFLTFFFFLTTFASFCIYFSVDNARDRSVFIGFFIARA
jgi:hypothetical protein